ncbi:hypothetical protein BKA65DRAFT_563006 [Rhexocercosporidium sp. MPI-PUGE-AT-0058]|nr:hypothetical protein BKA65DRAFT_563006 [Rhexocercosporidium sp. MPI-PUGE-AT-0058]
MSPRPRNGFCVFMYKEKANRGFDISVPMSVPTTMTPSLNLPTGWSTEWSAEYNTSYYVNDYTQESTWNFPNEPATGSSKHPRPVTTEVKEILLDSSAQSTPVQVPTMEVKPDTAVQPGRIPPSQRLQNIMGTQGLQQSLQNPPPSHVLLTQPSAHRGPEMQPVGLVTSFPPPPLSTAPNINPHHQDISQFPPPPPAQNNTQIQITFPPPPPCNEKHRQASNPSFEFAPTPTTAEPAPPTSNLARTIRPRPRSMIGHLELLKLQAAEQAQVYGAKLAPKLEHYGTKVGEKKEKEEKKLWDDRTDEEKKESRKKWGKRAAIGVGVVATVVVASEVAEHAHHAGNLAHVGNTAQAASAGRVAINSVGNTDAVNYAARLALAQAELQAARMRAAALGGSSYGNF